MAAFGTGRQNGPPAAEITSITKSGPEVTVESFVTGNLLSCVQCTRELSGCSICVL